jgi:hypothetical protein
MTSTKHFQFSQIVININLFYNLFRLNKLYLSLIVTKNNYIMYFLNHHKKYLDFRESFKFLKHILL